MFGMQTAELLPAVTPDLTALADVKVYAGVTGVADDALISGIISAASQTLEKYCDRALGSRAVTETLLPEDALSTLALVHCPVAVLTSITVGGVAQTLADFSLSKGAGLLRRKDGAAVNAPNQEITIEYGAGYAPVPVDLELAARQFAAALFQSRDRDPTVRSESVPDVGRIEYMTPDDALVVGPSGAMLPASIAGAIAPYVRWYAT